MKTLKKFKKAFTKNSNNGIGGVDGNIKPLLVNKYTNVKVNGKEIAIVLRLTSNDI